MRDAAFSSVLGPFLHLLSHKRALTGHLASGKTPIDMGLTLTSPRRGSDEADYSKGVRKVDLTGISDP